LIPALGLASDGVKHVTSVEKFQRSTRVHDIRHIGNRRCQQWQREAAAEQTANPALN
jgi:hypothetical protein